MMPIRLPSISKFSMRKGCVFILLSLVVSCTALKPVDRGASVSLKKSASPNELRKELIHSAKLYLGAPYRYGGTGSRGFDCSGLVYTVYTHQGISMPRSTAGLSSWGKKIPLTQAREGDLAFFKAKGKVNHVAIITKSTNKELWVIHSTSSRGVIHEDVLASEYWTTRFREARNPLAP